MLRIQDLLKKLIEKSEAVTHFEKLLKQKCAILRNILVQVSQCTSRPASKEENIPQKVQVMTLKITPLTQVFVRQIII